VFELIAAGAARRAEVQPIGFLRVGTDVEVTKGVVPGVGRTIPVNGRAAAIGFADDAHVVDVEVAPVAIPFALEVAFFTDPEVTSEAGRDVVEANFDALEPVAFVGRQAVRYPWRESSAFGFEDTYVAVFLSGLASQTATLNGHGKLTTFLVEVTKDVEDVQRGVNDHPEAVFVDHAGTRGGITTRI